MSSPGELRNAEAISKLAYAKMVLDPNPDEDSDPFVREIQVKIMHRIDDLLGE